MSDGVVVRRATSKDVTAILELMRASLGDAIPRVPEFFSWKHFESPFGESLILLAEDELGLVGLRAMMRWRFLMGGRVISAVRPVDTATHPRFRRRGLFRRLTTTLLDELPAEGVQVVFNTPNESSRPGYLKMGWRSVGKLPIWVRPGGRFSLGSDHVRRSFDPIGLTAPARDERRAETDRSGTYYEWRYSERSGLGYRMAQSDGVTVVFRRRTRGSRSEVTLADLIVPRRRDIGAAARLLRRVIRSGGELQAVAMAALDTREAAALALAGFAVVPAAGPHLVVRDLAGASPQALFTRRGWRVQVGDLEVF